MKVLIVAFTLLISILSSCTPIAPLADATPEVEAPPLMENESLIETLQDYAHRAEEAGFSGSIFIARGDDVLLADGYGLADRTANIANTAETLYDIGSITKMFTAIAILQLESAGKLSIDDPITHYFADVPADKADITLHQILFHNAGLIDFVVGDDFTQIDKEEAIRETLNAPLLFAPGEDWSYSNAGFSLLAAVIEQVSDESYVAYLHRYIFEPAGMNDTGFYGDERWDAAQVAHGYVHNRDMDSPLDWPGPYWGIMGNGGIVTNVVDLARWDEALRTGVLLDEEATHKLYTPRLDMGVFGDVTLQEVYGGGVLVQADGSRISASTGGNDYGFVADYMRYMDEDVTVITLTNNEAVSAPFLARELVKILRGEPPVEPADLPQPDSD